MDDAKVQGIKKKIFLFFPAGVLAVALMLFLPAGSLNYWEAWVFLCVLFVPFIFVVSYLFRHDPGLLEKRMRFKEKEVQEKKIIKITQLLFFIAFLVPGLDYRFGWSDVPFWLVAVSDALVFIGYMIVFLVFRENTHASRIVEVEKNQKVISTGPYAVVRHPMYVGTILMFLFMPLALGSYFSLAFFVPIIIAIFFRIIDEEKLLLMDLEGYREYCGKVKYRLVPGIW
ncbi:Phospholipid methyltransferase [uncultured archaeon]|nr:Phospholipid methyltransferase [uncultured archaeon]